MSDNDTQSTASPVRLLIIGLVAVAIVIGKSERPGKQQGRLCRLSQPHYARHR